MNYIALLRGVNVGGKNKLKMVDLSQELIRQGFIDVKTYIQSGNILFKSDLKDCIVLAKQIENIIEQSFGLSIPVVVKSHKDLTAILNEIPFDEEYMQNSKKLYYSFLFGLPDKELLAKLNRLTFHPDQFKCKEDVIYLYYDNGSGRSKMATTAFERNLKLIATTRNWNTVNKLWLLSKYE